MKNDIAQKFSASEKCLLSCFTEIVSVKNDCRVYKISDTTGEAVMTSYPVYPGVEILYNDVHMQKSTFEGQLAKNVIEINHCREGRFECEIKDGFCYLGQGDMSIHIKNQVAQSSYFPLSHYHGISILIDMEEAHSCLSCILEGVNIDLDGLVQKFHTDSGCFIMRSNSWLEHIFSELYSVPDTIKYGYFKIKVLELLLLLGSVEIDSNKEKSHSIQKTQVELAKSIGAYLRKHMDEHITISRLSGVFGVSETHLKICFKKVYGVSVYSFIRVHKMQSAAAMLKGSTKNILEIAGDVGYGNGSKFAKAFRDVMGMTPKEYRNQNA